MKKKLDNLLNQIVELTSALTKQEVDTAYKHIIAYDSSIRTSPKMALLFKAIVHKKIMQYEVLKKNIAHDSSEASFNRLIRRTLYRLRESLILDINTNRKGQYSELYRKKFEIKRRIMQAQIISAKGLPKASIKLLELTIRDAKKYELYEELIEALRTLYSISTVALQLRDIKTIESDIIIYEEFVIKLREAAYIHSNYLNKAYSKSNNTTKITLLNNNIRTLKKYAIETNSSNIKSYYYLLLMEKYYIKNNINKEIRAGMEFLSILKSNKAILSRSRIAYIYSNLSNTLILACNFKLSFLLSKQSILWIENRSGVNKVAAYQTNIKSLFFLAEFIESLNQVETLQKLDLLNNYNLLEAQINYFKVVSLFALSHFQLANKMLYSLNEFEKDKEGWNLWVRIMRILCSIELLKLKLIDYDVENFRKYIQRTDKRFGVRKRDKLILSVLLELDRASFDFEIVAMKKKEVLNKLRSRHKDYKWEPKSPEMILFHEWFDAKLEKRAYAPNFEPYRKKIHNAVEIEKMLKEEMNKEVKTNI